MARFGCLLIILGVFLLFAVIVIPVLPFLDNNAAIDGYLNPLICQPGEKIIRELYSEPGMDGGTNFSMDVYCLDREEQRRDETGRWALTGGVGFIVPFMVGLLLFINGFSRRARTMGSTSTFGESPSVLVNVLRAEGEKSLAERLHQLQEARDKGFITLEEYDRLRKEILDDSV